MFCASFAVDWAVVDMLAIRQNTLGYIRYILKDGLRYLPFYGFYFPQVLFLTLNNH